MKRKIMKEFSRLVKIVEDLRNPEGGCPWDLKQTHKSLIANFVEELYETVEAIENNSFKDLKEELGDLILHIVMQAQIASEEKKFDITDVLNGISDKLIHRHPHVFGDTKVNNAQEVKDNWEKIKLDEKKRGSVLEGIPHSMPALIVAHRIQEKAASIGFDWNHEKYAMQKLDEEIKEFDEAYKNNDKLSMEDEIGDVLFSVVNVTRKLNIDAESSLRKTIKKFESRFKKVEKYFNDNKIDMKKVTLEKLDEVWDIAKKEEK